jgi:hypothetical protein
MFVGGFPIFSVFGKKVMVVNKVIESVYFFICFDDNVPAFSSITAIGAAFWCGAGVPEAYSPIATLSASNRYECSVNK